MMSDLHKPVVAHYIPDYLCQTETFIYQYLSHFRRIQPIVLAHQKTECVDQFPFSPVYFVGDLFAPLYRRWSPQWFLGRFDARVLRLPSERRVLRRLGVDLLHAHFGMNGYWALDLKRILQVPLVTNFYGVDVTKIPQDEFWQPKYQALFEDGDLFLVEGPYMRDNLVRLGCPSSKIQLQHIAIDVEKIAFHARSCLPNDQIRILMCGRMVEKKGYCYAIRAFARVATEFPNAKLILIGSGELLSEVQREVQQLGIAAQVDLKGYVNYEEYLLTLDQAHILIAPSVTAEDGDTEGGAPTVLLEAQASGLPTLSTLHADIPYIVNDGKTGFLVPERDVDSLAERLFHLLRNPDLWIEMGRAGRAHVEAHHNIQAEVQRLEQRYLALIDCGSSVVSAVDESESWMAKDR
jgi:colanic acid/amylovoran biosynthesis glycosyltransferase